MTSRPGRIRHTICLALMVLLATACTGIPDGVDAVTDFQLEPYLGTWYEIARLDHRFERGLTNVTATYSVTDDGTVRVVNRGYNADDQQWEAAEGKARFAGDEDVGKLEVSFFGPFYGAYNVIALDDSGYEWSMVAGPNRSYLWLLARSPDLSDDRIEALVREAKRLGFPVDELIFVEHTQPPPS